MPNWCDNQLTVTGAEDAVRAFMARVRPDGGVEVDGNKTDLSLEKIAPTPQELLDANERDDEQTKALTDKYGDRDWYAWRVRNWSTKWEVEAKAGDPFVVGGVHAVTYTFSSAWSPPIQALVTASGQHPEVTLRLSWAEPGNDCAQHVVLRNGQDVAQIDLDERRIPHVVVVDTTGRPVAHLEPWQESEPLRDDVALPQVLQQILDADLSEIPGYEPRVLVTCWNTDTVPAAAVEALAAVEDLRLLESDPLVFAGPSRTSLARSFVVEDDLLAAWRDEFYETVEPIQHWLPRELAQLAPTLAVAEPAKALTVQITCCLDVDPQEAGTVAGQALAAGVDPVAAVKFLENVLHEPVPLEDLLTVLTGALLPSDQTA